MDALWKLTDRLLGVLSRNQVTALSAVGIGLARTIHGWQLGIGRASDALIDSHLMIDAGEIAVFAALAAVVAWRGPLCRKSWPLLAGIGCLVVALLASNPAAGAWAGGAIRAVGDVSAGMAYALLLLVWLELCGCITPLQATLALLASYAVSLVGWLLLRSVTGVSGYVIAILLCLACALLAVQAYRAVSAPALPRATQPRDMRRTLSVPMVAWMVLMSFAYGFGDSFTQMGFSTLASKLGMVVPLVVVAVTLACLRDNVDIRTIYRMSLVLMGVGIVPTVLFNVLPTASQILMSAAQAGNMSVACVMACTSAHRRHESTIFGCGVLMAVSLPSILLGNAVGAVFIQACFALSEPMPRLAGTAIALMAVLLAAYLMRDEDLSSLVIDHSLAPRRKGPKAVETPLGAPETPRTAADPLARACAQLAAALAGGNENVKAERRAEVAALVGLSKRETAVFALMVDGHNIAVIGEELFIAQGTVRAHMSRIYEKLGVHSREEFSRLFAATAAPKG